jgi:NADH:ubiquinone oxidoreductase subunit 6 (subunit J)
MSTIAAALVNWNELWKIILTALVGGTGVVIVFGLLLLGISRAKTATRQTTRYGLYTLSGLCGVLVVAVVAIGIYAMTQKPSTPTPKPNAAAATLAPASATEPKDFSTT